MSDAPEEIGLVGNGFEWRLWNRHEDSDEQYAVRYILRDKHEAELSALKKQVEELTAERDDARRYAVEARLRENQAEDRRVSESFARTKAEIRPLYASPLPVMPITDEDVERAAKAVSDEWGKMVAEMSPHMSPGDIARSFVSPGNHRLIRAALEAAGGRG
jgi:hypothetical protein